MRNVSAVRSSQAGAIRQSWKRDYRWSYVPQRIKAAMRRDAALVARLESGARLADAELGTDATNLTDDEFLALLRLR